MDITGEAEAGLGLRERKKLRTRREISAATLRLVTERGFDSVTVDQIAAEAEVAPRTFFRYFDSKEDAFLADHPGKLEVLREALTNRPASEGPLTAVRAAILGLADGVEHDREVTLCRMQLMADHPTLRGRSLEMTDELERTIAEVVAERMQVDPETDLRPDVIAGAVCTAMRVAVDRWVAGGGTDDLPARVTEALDLLDGGLDRSVGSEPAEPTLTLR